ncbi:type II secretion system protein [Desulfuromonas thiophila]|uniref:type II secretion system protein n=1 Tax=Desulfuromonas thiophila TaxID=57664 RepID=UPI0024A88799|nr:type II secretion system protein [Desulfuromonas thiophila]
MKHSRLRRLLNQLLPALRRPRLAAQQGFTLLEILVVLTIMGFLIAMVAPRLSGLSNDAAGTVCDNNKGRGRDYIAGFYEKFNRYPNKLTNVVIADGTDADPLNNSYQIPPVDDQDPDNGAEVIKFEQASAFRPLIHRLSAAEAKELVGLGITQVVNLNDYSGLAENGTGGYTGADGRDGGVYRVGNWTDIADIVTAAPLREVVKIQEGLGVAMSGCGAATAASNAFTYTQPERNWGMDETFGRILLTIGPDSELVTSGMITKAGNSPSGVRNSDLHTFSEYWVILPRLEATSARLSDSGATFAAAFGGGTTTTANLQAATELIYPKGTGPTTAGYNITNNDSHYSVRTVDLTAAQEPWAFSKQRDQDGDQYAYNLDGNAALN